MIDDQWFSRFGLAPQSRSYRQLGQTNSAISGTLTFLDTRRFIDSLLGNANIEGVIVGQEFVQEVRAQRPELALYSHPDPRWAFFTVHNEVARVSKVRVPTVVHPDADVHPAAYVAEHNVVIGKGSRIAPGSIILEDVEIGENCIVQPGAVVGSEGFEYKRTQSGLLSVVHDGKVIIGNCVEIGANSCIDKGFAGRPTTLEDECKVDNLVHVAHAVRIGKGALVVAGTVLGGSSYLGEKAWISINASVAPGLKIGRAAFVSMGAVVTKDVPDDEHVTGNFAVPHADFLRSFKRWLRGGD